MNDESVLQLGVATKKDFFSSSEGFHLRRKEDRRARFEVESECG